MANKFKSEFDSNKDLHSYLLNNNLTFSKLLAYGKSSWIIILKQGDNLITMKLQRKDSNRDFAIENEVRILKVVNQYNIGQKLLDYNLEIRFATWQYIDGTPLSIWAKGAKREEIILCKDKILKMAKELDDIDVDHSQLAGAGTNILIDSNSNPIFVDFEKASLNRKAHNYNILKNYFEKMFNIKQI